MQLPYIKNIYKKLSAILKQYNIISIPLVKKSLNSIIKLGKDVTKKWDRTNIVYKFTCKNCPAAYIGETKRTLKKRINEHRNNKNEDSVVNMHQNSFNHQFDWEGAVILDNESNYKKRLMSEMMHIKCHNNNINKKEDIFTLNKSYIPVLRKFKC